MQVYTYVHVRAYVRQFADTIKIKNTTRPTNKYKYLTMKNTKTSLYWPLTFHLEVGRDQVKSMKTSLVERFDGCKFES